MADYDEVIPPGQEGKIHVRLIGRQLAPGRFRKSYTLMTNDPEKPRVVLYTNGTVRTVFQVSNPLSISGFRDDDLRDEIMVSVAIDQPARITGYHWESGSRAGRDIDLIKDAVEIRITPLEGGRRFKVEAWLEKPLPPKQYFAQLNLETDFKDLPVKQVPFNIQVMDDVQAHPNMVYMQELVVSEGTTKSFERMLSVVAARGDSLKILEVVPSDATMTYSLREVRPGQSYQCRLQIRPPTQPGVYNATITFRTNYKGYEEIVVPIRGAVRVTRDGR